MASIQAAVGVTQSMLDQNDASVPEMGVSEHHPIFKSTLFR